MSQLDNILESRNTGHWREAARISLTQIYFTFVQAIPLTVLMAILVGMTVSFQVQISLSLIGGLEKLGRILAIILFREMTPLFVTILIIIRSVTATTSELATMKVQQELDALEIMGIQTFDYIILPRIISGAISFFCLAVVFIFAALLGSWIGSNIGASFQLGRLLADFSASLTPSDFLFFIIKNTVIGSMIMRHACFRGLSLKKAPFEVPIVTNQAVVEALIFGIFLQVSFSVIFYLFVGIKF